MSATDFRWVEVLVLQLDLPESESETALDWESETESGTEVLAQPALRVDLIRRLRQQMKRSAIAVEHTQHLRSFEMR